MRFGRTMIQLFSVVQGETTRKDKIAKMFAKTQVSMKKDGLEKCTDFLDDKKVDMKQFSR